MPKVQTAKRQQRVKQLIDILMQQHETKSFDILSDHLGITTRSLIAWHTGAKWCSDRSVRNLCSQAVIPLSPDYFIYGKGKLYLPPAETPELLIDEDLAIDDNLVIDEEASVPDDSAASPVSDTPPAEIIIDEDAAADAELTIDEGLTNPVPDVSDVSSTPASVTPPSPSEGGAAAPTPSSPDDGAAAPTPLSPSGPPVPLLIDTDLGYICDDITTAEQKWRKEVERVGAHEDESTHIASALYEGRLYRFLSPLCNAKYGWRCEVFSLDQLHKPVEVIDYKDDEPLYELSCTVNLPFTVRVKAASAEAAKTLVLSRISESPCAQDIRRYLHHKDIPMVEQDFYMNELHISRTKRIR